MMKCLDNKMNSADIKCFMFPTIFCPHRSQFSAPPPAEIAWHCWALNIWSGLCSLSQLLSSLCSYLTDSALFSLDLLIFQ